MNSLFEQAEAIVEAGRAAGHPQITVHMALAYVRDEDLNSAATKLRHLKEKGAPPRWLIRRWATIAGLASDPKVSQ